MIKLLIWISTIIFLYSGNCLAYVRDYSGLANTWESESSKAYISGKTTFDDGKTIINLFIISFEKEYECKPVFKISFLEGNSYGDFLKTEGIKEGLVNLYVDDKIIFDGSTVKVTYSNATEFGSGISEDILNQITSGKILKIELVGIMDIKFNLNKSRINIDNARKECLQEK